MNRSRGEHCVPEASQLGTRSGAVFAPALFIFHYHYKESVNTMRRLLWFTLGFGGSTLLCSYLFWKRALWVPALLCICAWILLCCIGGKWEPAFRAAAVFLGCGAALLWFSFFRTVYLAPVLSMDGRIQTLTVTAARYSEEAWNTNRAEGWFMWEGKPYRILLTMDENVFLAPGDTVTSEFLVRLTVPGGERESLSRSGSGIFLLGTQKGEAVLDASSRNAWYLLPEKAASRLNGILEMCLPRDTAAFARALLLGDTDGLDYETDTALKISGIRHVAAVSGLHVGILYGIIQALTLRKRWLKALIGIPVMAFFAAMAGFSPSVSRACLMTGLAMLADAFLREYDSASALSFGVLILLLLNPFSAASVSLQLSVSSVAGILLVFPKLYGWYQKKTEKLPKRGIRGFFLHWFGSSVGICVSTMVFTIPLSALYFGTVSLIAIVTNLLTLWCVMLIFCGAAMLCAVGLIHLRTGLFLGKLLAWPIRYVLWIAKTLSGFPLAAVYTQSGWITAWLIFSYLLLALFLLRRRHPLRWVGICACGLAAAVFFSWWIPQRDDFRVTVLDVGQGQCILLQSRSEAYLVDCGGSFGTAAADTAAEMLLSQGIRQLDGILLTHFDSDHTNGLPYLLRRVRTRTLFLPAQKEEAFLRSLSLEDGTVRIVEEIQMIPIGSGSLTLYPAGEESRGNDNCICVLFTAGNCDILITGDRTAAGERALVQCADLPGVDILIAGHHGSAYSSSQLLLDTVQPETVVISVGENNLYGHPDPELLERLERYGCRVRRTDLEGTIYFRG